MNPWLYHMNYKVKKKNTKKTAKISLSNDVKIFTRNTKTSQKITPPERP